jgi:hypothetical protein
MMIPASTTEAPFSWTLIGLMPVRMRMVIPAEDPFLFKF